CGDRLRRTGDSDGSGVRCVLLPPHRPRRHSALGVLSHLQRVPHCGDSARRAFPRVAGKRRQPERAGARKPRAQSRGCRLGHGATTGLDGSGDMDFAHSPKVQELAARLARFMDDHVYPAEPVFAAEVEQHRRAGNPWVATKVMEELKGKARAAGLWNLFLPDSDLGAGLTNLEYAPLCEIMGRSWIAPEAFNCNAPDTGNMEVLVRYGTEAQKERWLLP